MIERKQGEETWRTFPWNLSRRG